MAKWGSSQVEFRTLWAEIKDRLESGDSLNTIYGAMRDAGRITMSRSAFYKIHNGLNTAPRKGAAPRRGPKAAARQVMSAAPGLPAIRPSSAVVNTTLPTVEGHWAQQQDVWGSPNLTPEPGPEGDASPHTPPEEDSNDAE